MNRYRTSCITANGRLTQMGSYIAVNFVVFYSQPGLWVLDTLESHNVLPSHVHHKLGCVYEHLQLVGTACAVTLLLYRDTYKLRLP